MGLKSFAKRWLPPALAARLKPLVGGSIYFSGDFPTWTAASANSTGYDSDLILERVSDAMLKVTRGEAKYERDSVLFDRAQISFPVLAGLFRAASESGNRLSVLDFGGSLGSSYIQCREFLSVLPELKWGIVEQKHFVDRGRQRFQTGQLKFHHTIAECVAEDSPNVALLSSVLQYLPAPGEIVDELMAARIPYLIVDRTPFIDGSSDRITIQHVPESIYRASYPCRLFGRQRFIDRLRDRYDLIAEFDGFDGTAFAGGMQFAFGGMIFCRS